MINSASNAAKNLFGKLIDYFQLTSTENYLLFKTKLPQRMLNEEA
jgi:hypothetical protein